MMEEDDDYVEYVPVAKRRAMEEQKILQRKGNVLELEEEEAEKEKLAESKPSLLVQATQLKKDVPEVSATEKIILQEKEMMEHLSSGYFIHRQRGYSTLVIL
ncbi:unnamed protein product [Eruca vesicaria subsp. sativa]|uniref:Uncharacterized protein n=1 Tax=Eruca vesicaria subsp. sativa TaxID=29727 RepID=A0ABC8KBD6_ERUVS|nr:unnamed protein product [Eruca vesicaria subsp. sativa]